MILTRPVYKEKRTGWLVHMQHRQAPAIIGERASYVSAETE